MERSIIEKKYKVILFTLMLFVIILAIFSISNSSITAFAWGVPGDTYNYTNTNGVSNRTSNGTGNFPEIPNNEINKAGLFNIYDTASSPSGSVPSVFRLKFEDAIAQSSPDNHRWNADSAWRAMSSNAWVCNFESDGQAHRLKTGNPQESIFWATIKLSPLLVEGLKNGDIEITYSNLVYQPASSQKTGVFAVLGSATNFNTNGYRELDGFTTKYGNESGEAEYTLRRDNSNGALIPSNEIVSGQTYRRANIWQGTGTAYMQSKLGKDYRAYPNLDTDNTYLRVGTFLYCTKATHQHNMWQMKIEVRVKRGASVTAENKSKTYGDANPSFTFSESGFLEGDTVDVSHNGSSYTGDIVAGSYPLTISGHSQSNNAYYEGVTINNGTFTVSKRNVTVNPQHLQSKVYGTAEGVITYSNTFLGVAGASLQGSLARSNSSNENVGSYEIVDGNMLSNASNTARYNITITPNVNFTIDPKPVTVKIFNKTSVYKASLETLVWELNAGSTMAFSEVAHDTLSITLSTTATTSSSPGSYDISAATGSTTASNNYSITYINEEANGTNGTYTITKGSRTVAYTGVNSKEYNGATQYFTGATLSDEHSNSEITYSGNSFLDVPSNGKLNFTINGAATTNYEACSLEVEVSVTKISLTVRIEDSISVYKEALSQLNSTLTNGVVASGQDASKTYIEVLSLVLNTTAELNSQAGQYPISATYSSANYIATFLGNHSDGDKGVYTIAKADSVISGSLGNYTFSGSEQTVAGLVLNHSESQIVYVNNTFIDVPVGGSLEVSYSVAESNNYKGIANTAMSVAISKAETIIDTSGVLLEYTYNGATQTVDAGATTNQIATASVPKASIEYSNNSFGNVTSTGKQTVTILTQETMNYFGKTTSVEISIAKYNISFSINNKEKIYGENDPSEWTYTVNSGSFQGSDDTSSINAIFGRVAGENVGEYNITNSSYNDANYIATFSPGKLTITAKSITATIANKTSVYGSAIVELTYSLSANALVSGDAEASLNIKLSKASGSTVGTYEITGEQTTGYNTNYSLTFANGTYTIKAKAITATITDKTSTYGEGIVELTYSLSANALVNGDTEASLKIVLSKAEGSTVGEYAITGSKGAGYNTNYELTFVNGVYSITKADSVISGSLGNYTFSGSEQTVAGLVLNHSESQIVYVNNTFIDVPVGGSLEVSYSVAESNNYKGIANTAMSVAISKAETIIDTSGVLLEYTYNGATQTVDAGATTNQIATASVPKANIEYSNNSFGNVTSTGKQTVTILTQETRNYFGKTTSVEISIAKYNISFSINNKEKIYGENDPSEWTYTVNSGSFQGSDDTSSINAIFGRVAGENVGEYNITNSSYNDANYIATFSPGKLTITAKSITATIANKTSVYGSAIVELTYSLSANALVSGDAEASLNIKLSKASGSTVGTYEITGEQTTGYNTNYSLTFANGTYTIKAKAITATITDKTSTYGEGIVELTYSLSANALVNGDTEASLKIVLSKAEGSTVGEYAITGSKGAGYNTNYELTFVNGVYSITAKSITATIANKTSVYGSAIVELTYTLSANALVSGDAEASLNIVLNKAEGNTVGTYEITGEQTTGYNSNYSLTFENGTYTITVKAIIVRIDNKSSLYGASLAPLTFSLDEGTLVGSDTKESLMVILSKAEGDSMGTYAITGSQGTGANPNYTVSFVDGVYTISGKTITVTIENKTSVYGEAILGLTYKLEYGALDGEDTEESLKIILTKAAGSVVGTYDITGSQGDGANPNYTVSFVDGVYTIKAKAITATIADKNSVYGDDIVELTYLLSENALISGDTEASLNIKLSKASGNTVGTYDITGSQVDGANPNYTVSFVDGVYTITVKEITATVDEKTSVYGENIAELTYSLSTTLVSGDTEASLKIKLSKAGGINVGSYVISGLQESGANANYQVAIENGTYTITKAITAIDVTQVELNYVYTGSEQTITGASHNQVGDFVSEIVYTNNTFTNVTVNGKLLVSISVAGNDNYIGASKTLEVNISKADTVINTEALGTYTYTGSEQTITGASHNQKGDFVSEIVYTNNAFTNVPDSGSLAINISVAENENYKPLSITFNVNVLKADTIINVSGIASDYTYNGSEQTIIGASHNQVGDFVSEIVYANNIFTDVPVDGNLSVIISVAENKNYNAASLNHIVNIAKAKGTIDVSNMKRWYGEDETYPITISSGATVSNSEQTVDYRDNVFENYEAIQNGSVIVFVNETQNYLSIEIAFKLNTGIYDPEVDISGIVKNYVYTGVLQVINSGAVLVNGGPGQEITYANNSFTTVNEGNSLELRVYVEGVGDWSSWSEIVRINVEKAETTVGISGPDEQVYGSFTRYAGSLNLSVDDGSLVEHRVAISYSYQSTYPRVGTHTAYASFAGSANFKPSSASKEFVVTKKKVDLIYSDNVDFPYTGKAQVIGYSIDSPAYNDNNIVTVKYGANNPSKPGTYPISYTLNNQNYEIKNVLGPAEIEITRVKLNVRVKYDGYAVENKDLQFIISYQGFAPSANETSIATKAQVVRKSYVAGSYSIKAEGAVSEGYDFNYLPYEFTVYKDKITENENHIDATVTGIFEANTAVKVDKIDGSGILSGFDKATNRVTSAFTVEIENSGNSPTSSVRRVSIKNSNIKAGVFTSAYIIDTNGTKLRISKEDIKNGYIEANLGGNKATIVVFDNMIVVYSIPIAIAIFIIFKIATRNSAYRKKRSRKVWLNG